MVIGYGCAGFSLLSIEREIRKWIAFITNTTFVIYGLIGMVYLAVILPIKVGLFDKVP
jgi:type II secretory pathway component PulF